MFVEEGCTGERGTKKVREKEKNERDKGSEREEGSKRDKGNERDIKEGRERERNERGKKDVRETKEVRECTHARNTPNTKSGRKCFGGILRFWFFSRFPSTLLERQSKSCVVSGGRRDASARTRNTIQYKWTSIVLLVAYRFPPGLSTLFGGEKKGKRRRR